jgi:hypothetical protein
MNNISVYPNITKTDSKDRTDIPIDIFLMNIQSGKWQDIVIKLRVTLDNIHKTILDPKERDKQKQAAKRAVLPYACISGTFSNRNNEGLLEHSGHIAIDIDDSDPEETKRKLRNDKYVYSMFTSCSGGGLCVIFKINSLKHLESFEGIAQYLFENYQIVVDQNCKDISRPRYISFDPNIFINDHAQEFKQYPKGERPGPKSKEPPKDVVFIQSEFANILKEIEDRGVDIVPDYRQWVKIAYSLADKFGEDGRDYFHAVSRQGSTYTESACNRQFDAVLKNLKDKSNPATIASFYYICKEAGISIVSPTVQEISKRAATHKKAHATVEQAIKNIIEFPGGIEATPELIADIATQVYRPGVIIEDVSDIEAGRVWLRNKNLCWNLVTGLLENDGKEMNDKHFCNLRLQMREDMPKLARPDIADLLGSDAIPSRHDIFEFFKKHKDRKPTGVIAELAACIKSPTGEGTDYVERMLRKWLVGGVANLYEHSTFGDSPLMVVLCGTVHGTGKSYFMSHLLPEEMRRYSALKDFSLLREGGYKRDMDIAITRKWFIYDDEMGGKSKRDHRVIKAMLSAPATDVRAAYAKNDEHRKRIAFFGGTSNDLDVISEHGEQRRVIPIEVEAMDKKRKDNIDLIDLWVEAYNLYHSGFNYTVLDADIKFLNEQTEQYAEVAVFDMMIANKFEPSETESFTLSEIGARVKDLWPAEKWTTTALGIALKRIGVKQFIKKIPGTKTTERRYPVKEKAVSITMLQALGRRLEGTGGTRDPF